MSSRQLRAGVSGVAVVVVVVTVGLALACGSETTTHYVALGDSIAEGRGATDADKLGYVALFNEFYQEDHNGPETLTTYQQQDETSASVIANQVANAVRVIVDDETDVEVVTLTIGGNDFLPLVGQEPCKSNPVGPDCQAVVGAALVGFSQNFPVVLGQINVALASDPGDERFIVTTYYNPYRGTGSPFELPTDGILFGTDGKIDCAANATDPAKAGVNDMITCFADGVGATVVDLYPVITDKALTHTHIATGDIHPNDDGYRLIADAVIAAYQAGK